MKTLILKDSRVRSIWTCLTASPCYSTNTSIHIYQKHIGINKQLINAVLQNSFECAEIWE